MIRVDEIYQLNVRIGFLEAVIKNAIKAMERGAPFTPTLESLKAAVSHDEQEAETK